MIKKVLILCFCLMLCGCYDNREPNDIAFVTAVGIDRSKKTEENFDFTFQIARPTEISGGSSDEGGKGGDIIQNITVEAPTLYAGIETANFIISKTLSLAHIKLFVFSEEVAREGIADLTETMSRSEEIRPNVYMAVAKESSKEYLESVKPSVDINPVKYYQSKFDKEAFGGIPKSTNNEFYFYLKTDEKNIALPIASVIKTADQNQQEGQDSKSSTEGGSGSEKPKENEGQKDAPVNEAPFEYKIKDYTAGEIAIAEEDESELMGMAVFSGDKMIGEMGSVEGLIYNILTNRFKYGYVTFKSSKTDIPITILLQRTGKTKIDYDRKKEEAKITLFLDGEFVALPSDYITEKDTYAFEKEIKDAVCEGVYTFIKRLQNEFKSDIVGIGSSAKGEFLTFDEFKDYKWSEKFPEIDIKIKTNFDIERTGLTIRTEEN